MYQMKCSYLIWVVEGIYSMLSKGEMGKSLTSQENLGK